jgi:VanZ family protein
MAVISAFSTDAFSGSETSRLIGPLLRWLLPGAEPATLESIHGAIRKFGHLAEFGLLALLWYRALAWGRGGWRTGPALWAFLLSVGFAVLDETHQAFEATRTGSLADVGWDGLGAGFGLLVRRLLGRWGAVGNPGRPR